jgi:hypothetical protein
MEGQDVQKEKSGMGRLGGGADKPGTGKVPKQMAKTTVWLGTPAAHNAAWPARGMRRRLAWMEGGCAHQANVPTMERSDMTVRVCMRDRPTSASLAVPLADRSTCAKLGEKGGIW